MRTSRRDFIKSFAITLASLTMTRCGVSETPESIEIDPKDRVRACWLRLDWMAQQVRDSGLMKGDSSEAQTQLIIEHQRALKELVDAGEFDWPIASEMQKAFEEATTYVRNSSSVTVSCYEVSDPRMLERMDAEYNIEKVQADLVRQAELLQSFSGSIHSYAVTRAQEAIARDLTFLESKFRTNEIEELFQLYESDAIEVSPLSLEAARILAEILLSN
jgi:hypothetical protein